MTEEASPNFGEKKLYARLRFSPRLREVLAGLIERVHTAQFAAPAEYRAPAVNPADAFDPELEAAWAEGLRERNEHDNQALLNLIHNPQFGLADLPLRLPAAEAVMRGCTSVRLYLRETLLRNLSAAEAEGGLDVFGLPGAEQQGYACFRLLGYLEEDILFQLDPGLLHS